MLCRFVLALILVASWCGAAAAQRVALVIGNSAYREAPALANPANDAADVHAALVRLGFESEILIDADRTTLERSIRRFGDRAVGADAAMLFYAGHAVEVAGRNYLIPVSASIRSDRDLPFETVDVDTVMGQLEGRARVILLFLDACRDNPFRQVLSQASRGMPGRGLAAVRGPVGTLVAFSTAPGTVAQDGTGRNSPFTAALLLHIETPGLEVRPMLGRVRQSVREATGGAQVPWENASLEGEFHFGRAPAPAATLIARPAAADPTAQSEPDRPVERLFWESIRDSRSVAEFEAYLRRYPEGAFADLARSRIASLSTPPASVREGPPAATPRAADPAPRVSAPPLAPIPSTPPSTPPARASAPPQPLAPAPAAPAPAPAPQRQAGVARPPAPPPPATPPATPAPPADARCAVRISPGMATAAGAPGRMEMRNTGGRCGVRLWFNRVSEVPFRSMWISVPPQNGEATVANPVVRYRPRSGFTGEDRFVIETIPEGRVYMTVRVLPPE